MKRRPTKRSRRPADVPAQLAPGVRADGAASTSTARPKQDGPAGDDARRPAGPVERVRAGLILRVALGAAGFIFSGMVFFLFSLRWQALAWPTPTEVGLAALQGAVAVGVLAVAGGLAVLAERLERAGRPSWARVTLLLTLVLAGLFVGLRIMEYRALRDRGVWQRGRVSVIHDRCDPFYVQAVRRRLAEQFRELEEHRVNDPQQFAEQDRQRLELVTTLQNSMVAWTEEEVAHWLDELPRRRGVMLLLAYHVYPRADVEAEARSIAEEELRDLDRRKQWFVLLEDYCQQRVQWLNPPDAAGNSTQEPVTTEQMQELDRKLQADLERLGLAEWPYGVAVVADMSNPALARERLNQIRSRIDAIDARRRFHEELLDPLWEDDPRSEGLNLAHPWLRLPVWLPGGNAWMGGFFALTGSHLALVVVLTLVSLPVLILRRRWARPALWNGLRWWWLTAAVFGAVLFPLFYLHV